MPVISSPRPRVIIVGVDGSSSSIAALQLAAQLVPLAGDVLRAVTVWRHPFIMSVYTPVDWDEEGSAGECLDAALNEAFPDGLPLGLERRLIHGLPAKVLLEQSEHATMLVVGSRGHGGFTGLLLGSVSATVTKHAKCPVLVSHGALELLEDQDTPAPLGGVL
ncbi:universal stress protein [Arthrobacter subterraneus]|uniref:universal stress protein n=1 Tax=Arthrobacter subterraneus TaxID=335973 RepID=UPI003830A9A4